MRRLDASRDVSDEDVLTIVEAATKAATGGNSQPVRWMVVRDADARSRLGAIYRDCWQSVRGFYASQEQTPTSARMLGSADHLGEHMGDAPVLILPCSKGQPGQAESSVFPGVQNLFLAGRALGLGTTLTTVHRFEVVGVSALGIIGLMSFLIGIVIAQQGAVQLRQFGAEVFTINLVGRITLRELGVLMTAIMVAGRSGSAFAAQLGTMKLTEEIDAMRTIGVSPMEALVVPRTLAVVLMMPLLGFYSSLVAIIGGGLLCWVSLDIPPVTYIQRLREVVPMTDLYVGLVKAPVFGAIIAMAGCFQGMQVEGDAEQVGTRTTAAVVQAIFLVIVLDAFFAVFFTWIGWT